MAGLTLKTVAVVNAMKNIKVVVNMSTPKKYIKKLKKHLKNKVLPKADKAADEIKEHLDEFWAKYGDEIQKGLEGIIIDAIKKELATGDTVKACMAWLKDFIKSKI